MRKDDRVDDYIARQADFARPILIRIRAAMHRACPHGEEAVKWGAPAFLYKGKQIAIMAAFKAHAALNFPHGAALTGKKAGESGAMGQFGRLESPGDLPPDAELERLAREAMELIEQGVTKPKIASKPVPDMPDDFRAALDAAPAAMAMWEGFSPSAQRDYLDWIVGAKRAETRAARIAQAVQWIAEGKRRNWKYEKGCAS